MPTKIIALQRKYRLTWYYKNKDRQIARQKQKRQELKEWLDNYKRTLFCSDCGMSFREHPECCDFHHVRDKKGDVPQLLKYSKKTTLEEIMKCIPLCANCHRIKHYER